MQGLSCTDVAELLGALPRLGLAHLPTPLEPLPRLSREIGREIWIKRDDCTGLALGGNKTRKLEFLIGQALAQGAEVVILASGYQSNFIRQTAAACARLGLEFHAIIAEPAPGREDHYFRSGNLLLDELLGAHFHVAANEGEASDEIAASLEARFKSEGRGSFRIGTGDTHAKGALGYVNCACEIARQSRERGFAPGSVAVVTGGGGGQAGLIAGFGLLGLPTMVVGFSCSEAKQVKARKVADILDRLSEVLGWQGSGSTAAISMFDQYAGEGYAIATPAANEAISLVARLEGIILDPVYTGKAMAGVIDLLARGEYPAEGPIVFVHSGGVPALFVYDDEFWRGIELRAGSGESGGQNGVC